MPPVTLIPTQPEANLHPPIIPEDVTIFMFDNPELDFTWDTNHGCKEEFITEVVDPAITRCPKLWIIWEQILQAPLIAGYITWEAMIILIAALYQHDFTDHVCTQKEVVHTFIMESLLLCRIIHYPPFPGGVEDKKPFYAISKHQLGKSYDHFEKNIFKNLDKKMGHRIFDSIRETPGLMDKKGVKFYGEMAVTHLRRIDMAPEVLDAPSSEIPPGISNICWD